MAKARSKKQTPTIFVVSDGRGETCSQLVKAALVQFAGVKYRIARRAKVLTPARVEKIVDLAAESRAVVFYTLAADETRSAMKQASARKLVPTVDLLGPAFSALHDLFKANPQYTPGLLYAADHERIDRIEAIDYTLKHDDGQRPHELHKADVVLVGVSRVAKSSTCFYLAYAGVRAANVPLIPGIEPPQPLLRMDPNRVIGLRVNVMRLMTMRESRAINLGLDFTDKYVDKREISREVLAANRMMDKHGWRSFDVSYLAIEEIAREVINTRGLLRTAFH